MPLHGLQAEVPFANSRLPLRVRVHESNPYGLGVYSVVEYTGVVTTFFANRVPQYVINLIVTSDTAQLISLSCGN